MAFGKGVKKSAAHREAIRAALLARRGEKKRCKGCQSDIPISEFPERRTGVLASRCLPCFKDFRRKEVRKTICPERIRRNNRRGSLKRYHGITIEQYDAILESQGGKCAICEKTAPRLSVDHRHSDGVIRGLLCPRCNTAIGMMEDDAARAMRAAEYVARVHPPNAMRSAPGMPSGHRERKHGTNKWPEHIRHLSSDAMGWGGKRK